MEEDQKKTETLSDIFEKTRTLQIKNVPTFNEDLDRILQGGLEFGQMIQIVGFPGIGKSQLCMQVACNATLPISLGGCNGVVHYYDSGYNLSLKRVTEISECLVKSFPDEVTQDSILSKIEISRPHSLLTLSASILSLDLLHSPPNVIIIDSFPIFMKQTEETYRFSAMTTVMTALATYCRSHHALVLVVNNITSKQINTNYFSSTFNPTPDLKLCFVRSCGIHFSSFFKYFIFLCQPLNKDLTAVVQSPSFFLPQMCTFQIFPGGFR
ncbi:hypothetical protein EIN_118340 [Entamoeba invadens IP1]|uniref:DNA repair protein RAD51 homolog 3 n=1 Tax=Entamoeba invadens IP1 TaxID=370355 RepID=L7FPY6_ENTIV|nr:hypothetical protein EIN_118340 [Entamoeba invadens IP1]ELP92260.1 hypothetical protein EIN_118340 [Entamoeba invadens IP1]|eukprot:XP_004259031.1 hypothetical protein EIN_118340 [Entamoeba invadens IP1]